MSDPGKAGRPLGVAALLAVTLLAAGTWWFLRDGDPGNAAIEPLAPVAAHEAPLTVPAEDAPAQAPVIEAAREVEPPVAAPAYVASPAPESYTRELAGLRGRLVEEDGTPVPGKKVEILELHFEALLASLEHGFSAVPEDLSRLDVASDVTGEDGVFVLRGAQIQTFHLLQVDAGGPRSTVRFLDVALEPGESYDLGDLVLAPFVTLTGTVVGEESEAIAGARVRVIPQLPWPIPTQALEIGLQDVRSDCLLVVTDGEQSMLFEPPPFLRALVDRFPVPTASTDAEGAFELPGVPPGVVTLLVDKPGYRGTVRAGVATGRRDRTSIGTLHVSFGRTLAGRVMAGERGVSGARVFAGAVVSIDSSDALAILQPAGSTGADGRFTLRGLPEAGNVWCAVQRTSHDPLLLQGPFERDDVVIELEPVAALTVALRTADGESARDAALRFHRPSELDQIPFVPPSPRARGDVREVEPGRYVVAELPVGKWIVFARTPESGIGSLELDLPPEGVEVSIDLPKAREITAHVSDAATQQPVEHALLSAMTQDDGSFFSVPMPTKVARTDPSGIARLEQLPADARVAVRVTHPGYVPALLETWEEGVTTSAGEVAVALLRGGTLSGRVTIAGEAPPAPLFLVADHSGGGDRAPEDEIPRFAVTGLDGTFRLTHLAAGQWDVTVFPRVFFGDPLAIFKYMEDEPDELGKAEVILAEGEETTVEIECAAPGDGRPCVLRGRVRIDGEPAGGLDVQIYGRRFHSTTTDDAGRFEWNELRAGSWTLQVIDNRGSGNATLHTEEIQLAPGEMREVDVSCQPIAVAVKALLQDGSGARRAQFSATYLPVDDEGVDGLRLISSNGVSARADNDGTASLALPMAGRWRIEATVNEVGSGRIEVDVPEGGLADPVVIEIVQGVLVSGRIEFGETVTAHEDCWVSLSPATEEGDGAPIAFDASANVKTSDPAFEFRGVVPGSYRLQVFVPGSSFFMSDPFTIGPGDTTELRIPVRKF